MISKLQGQSYVEPFLHLKTFKILSANAWSLFHEDHLLEDKKEILAQLNWPPYLHQWGFHFRSLITTFATDSASLMFLRDFSCHSGFWALPLLPCFAFNLLFTCRAGCLILHPAKTECTGTSPGADTSSMLRQQSGSVPCSFYYVFFEMSWSWGSPLLYGVMVLCTDLGNYTPSLESKRMFPNSWEQRFKKNPTTYTHIYTHEHTHAIRWSGVGRKVWKYLSVSSCELIGHFIRILNYYSKNLK